MHHILLLLALLMFCVNLSLTTTTPPPLQTNNNDEVVDTDALIDEFVQKLKNAHVRSPLIERILEQYRNSDQYNAEIYEKILKRLASQL